MGGKTGPPGGVGGVGFVLTEGSVCVGVVGGEEE